jgi:hypothetical protein
MIAIQQPIVSTPAHAAWVAKDKDAHIHLMGDNHTSRPERMLDAGHPS